jgi:CBS domain-containing protein
MSVCPFCGTENIEGIDSCEQCGESLVEVHLHEPATEVERSLLKDHIGVLGPRPALTVAPTTPVRDVIQTLVDNRIGCLIVEENGHPVGIFSERDALLKLNTEAAELGDRPVSEFMTPNPQSLKNNAKIAFAVQRMDLGGYRHIPIVNDKNDLEGIISVRDILRYVTEKMK